MLNYKKIVKVGLLIIAVLLLIVVAGASVMVEKAMIMGVNTIEENRLNTMTETSKIPQVTIFFNDIPAAVDSVTRTVYISQNIDESTKTEDLKGVLSVDNKEYSLVLVKDDKFDNLAQMVKNNQAGRLLLITPQNEYVQYNIVFSTLPIINIYGDITGVNEQNRDIFSGEICFWDSYSAETNTYRTVSSPLQWNIRGNTIVWQDKKSWKISLKDNMGEKENISFCGLGEDDDWILNPMVRDDVKIREKFVMDLWEEMRLEAGSDIKMSQGEYVEVVLNHQYQGLYLLQRRVDGKYLNLDNDILLKGGKYNDPIATDNVEIEYSLWDTETTKQFLYENFDEYRYVDYVDKDNLSNINILLGFAGLVDNVYSKNIFYLLENPGSDMKVSLVLWDTDMSLGLIHDGGFVYNFDLSLLALCKRTETVGMLIKKPEFIEYEINQWNKYRKNVFDEDKLVNQVEEYVKTITRGGSLKRDEDRWGKKYSDDNMENFYAYIKAKLEYMDFEYENSYYQGMQEQMTQIKEYMGIV